MNRPRSVSLIIVILLAVPILLGLIGCTVRVRLGSAVWEFNLQSTPTVQQTYTPNPTFTPNPTLTPNPTYSLQPTYTRRPSYTPYPTLTPLPSYTRAASQTPLPPLATKTGTRTATKTR